MKDIVRQIVSAYVRSVAAPLSPQDIEYARAAGMELPPRADVDPDSPETVFRALVWATACVASGADPLTPEHTPTLH